MKNLLSILALVFFLFGILNAQNQTAKPLIMHKTHIKENKQLIKNPKNEKLKGTLQSQNKNVIHLPKKRVPIDNSIKIQKNSIKPPSEN
jgi:hypothetical protein